MSSEPKKVTNKKWIKTTIIAIVSISLIVLLSVGSYYLFFKTNELSPAPDFTVKDLDGLDFQLSENNDKIVLIDFMSTTCIPCRQQMPELVELSEKYEDNLTIISINIESSESEAQLINFRDEFNATWSFAFDTDSLVAKYSVISIPKAVIVDTDGFITYEESAIGAKPAFEDLILDTLEGNLEQINIGISLEFGLAFALLAGFISFFSPCAFPLLPGYVAINLKVLSKDKQKLNDTSEESVNEKELASSKKSNKSRFWKSVKLGLAAASGIILFYMIIGLITAGIGSAIAPWIKYFMPVMGVIFLILGIIMLIPKIRFNTSFGQNLIAKMMKRRRNSEQEKLSNTELDERKATKIIERSQMMKLFLYGIGYSLASIGCNGPILVAIISYSLSSGGFGKALLTFSLYALAMAILMVIITILVGFSKDNLLDKLKRSTKVLNIISGIILLLVGGFLIGYFIFGYFGIV